VKLLLDENLSERIIPHILDLYPGSTHVKAVGLETSKDELVWEWAKQHGFTIVSKDSDFFQRGFLTPPPPKSIWIRVGNCPTALIVTLLRSHEQTIKNFLAAEAESVLVLF
jgi:predicted nuclease of predicted toxin-antitoxin system